MTTAKRTMRAPEINQNVAKAILSIRCNDTFEQFAKLNDVSRWKLVNICLGFVRKSREGVCGDAWFDGMIRLMSDRKKNYKKISKMQQTRVVLKGDAEACLVHCAQVVLSPDKIRNAVPGYVDACVHPATYCAFHHAMTDGWDSVRLVTTAVMCRMTNTDPDSLATIVVAPAFKDL